MFRIIAFVVVCLLSAAAYFMMPGVPIPTESLHRQAQSVAAKAEQKFQEYKRVTTAPAPAPDPLPVGAESQQVASVPTRESLGLGPNQTPGETAAIYARIITTIERQRKSHLR